jgi:hypothetical protein
VRCIYVVIGGRRESTKDYVVPRSFKSPVLVGVDSFTYRKICVAVQKVYICDRRSFFWRCLGMFMEQ